MIKKFTNAFCMLCQLSNRNYTDLVFELYRSELEPYGLDKAAVAMVSFAVDGKFPTVNQIRERMGIVTQAPDEEQKARVLANEVWAAIERFGGYDQKGASQHFGPEKWKVVTAFGSWPQICEILTEEKSNFLAQFREFAKAYRLNDAYEEQKDRLRSGATNIIAELAASVDRTSGVRLLE